MGWRSALAVVYDACVTLHLLSNFGKKEVVAVHVKQFEHVPSFNPDVVHPFVMYRRRQQTTF